MPNRVQGFIGGQGAGLGAAVEQINLMLGQYRDRNPAVISHQMAVMDESVGTGSMRIFYISAVIELDPKQEHATEEEQTDPEVRIW